MKGESFAKIISDSDPIPHEFEDHLLIAPDYNRDRGDCYILPGYESPSQFDWFMANSVVVEPTNGNHSRSDNRKAHHLVIPPVAFDRPPAGTLVPSYVVSCYSCGKLVFTTATKVENAERFLKTEENWHRITEHVSDDCRSAGLAGYQGLWLCPECYHKLAPQSDIS